VAKKTKAELAAELRFTRQSKAWEVAASLGNNLIRYGTAAWCAYMAYLSIDALAGRRTLAWIGINALANVKISVVIGWFVGIAGFGYGLRQRKLRRDTIARLSGRIQYLEKVIDPGRTSSKLTERGETRPEDSL
jgi:hypothetical protein